MAENEKQVTAAADDKAKEKAPAKVKKDKVSIFKKLGKFFRECRSEMKKIVWYSREQTIRSSIVVIVFIIIIGVIVSALDFGFSKCLNLLAGIV